MTDRRDLDNRLFVGRVQRWLGVRPDEWAGDETAAAWEARTGDHVSAAWPSPDERSLRAFYGEPGAERNLVSISLPYPMVLAWDGDPSTPAFDAVTVRSTRCHHKVAESLRECLAAILAHYGSIRAVQEARMNMLGGVFNPRRQRGGSAWSLHAWGAAIDIDPEQNGFRTPWPAVATMPEAVIEIFEARGWKSGARAWGRDSMHFQGTR
jgi:hypothetical protein